MEEIYPQAVKTTMLELHFINVGDGDALLVEDREGGTVFRLLVDAGEPSMEPYPGSLRLTAADYLREKQISYIDVLVVTHLHIDHFGGVETLLPEVGFGTVYSGFFPEAPGERIAPPSIEAVKTVRGMVDCVNRWAGITEALRAKGAALRTVDETVEALCLTERLSADIIVPSETMGAVQRLTWRAMLAGRPITDELKYAVAKSRNLNSLRMRLNYAGRRVELGADCFGWVWENEELAPCDILKVPHHGAPNALTETLLAKLRPRCAVVSCEAAYTERKDRPSRLTGELLERAGCDYWFTDSFSADWHAPDRWKSVDFTIYEDGTIIGPEGRKI